MDVRLADPQLLAVADAAKGYLTQLDRNRLAWPYRREAGLPQPSGVSGYPNWESTGLDGHILGHALSAWVAWGQWHEVDEVVRLISDCQHAIGTGYVAGIPDGQRRWDQVAQGRIDASPFELNGMWVPLYNLHKLATGLHDVAEAGQTPLSATAHSCVMWLLEWFEGVAANLNDEQFRIVLACEYGGFNDAVVRMAAREHARGGDAQRWLTLARRFDLDPVFSAAADGDRGAGDRALDLRGLHANTQIPKAIGWARLAAMTGSEMHRRAAVALWDSVVGEHSVSIGGHSVGEHFHDPSDFTPMITSRQGIETCNTVNMVRLTRILIDSGMCSHRRAIAFIDRAMANHVPSTVRVERPGFVYFTPMRPGSYRTYSTPDQCMWCCVGIGLEAHAEYTRDIYRDPHASDLGGAGVDLMVERLIDSDVRAVDRRGEPFIFSQRRVDSSIDGDHEGLASDLGSAVTCLTGEWRVSPDNCAASTDPSRRWRIGLRIPAWCSHWRREVEGEPWHEIRLFVDGSDIDGSPIADIVVEVGAGELVRLSFLAPVAAEPLPDKSPWVSIVSAGRVFALDLGSANEPDEDATAARTAHIPSGRALALASTPIIDPRHIRVRDEDRIEVALAEPRQMAVQSMGEPMSTGKLTTTGEPTGDERRWLILRPLTQLAGHRYSVYLPAVSPTWTTEDIRCYLDDLDASERGVEARTIDAVAVGQQQSEIDHRVEEDGSEVVLVDGIRARRLPVGAWVSYELADWERVGETLWITGRKCRDAMSEPTELMGEPWVRVSVDGVEVALTRPPAHRAGTDSADRGADERTHHGQRSGARPTWVAHCPHSLAGESHRVKIEALKRELDITGIRWMRPVPGATADTMTTQPLP